nr:reverse transcriptase domain-containing protein [Tanacetum cinerariifolium]
MCDTSDYAVGVVLGQRVEKHFWPIHYASKTMNQAETNYTTTEKEMLAVVYTFEKFRSYLIMNKSIVYTDHSALKSDLKRREAYTAYSNPRGFIYQNGDKKNRLMRIDKLHKFSDGTLNDVHNALDDRLKGIRMQYLPTTIWRKGDKDKAAAMIQAFNKMLKTRRIMRSLERFVGGRQYKGDLRMLQRTI